LKPWNLESLESLELGILALKFASEKSLLWNIETLKLRSSLINQFFMVTGSWLMAQGSSCLKARGSRLMAHG
jgi:hypothetical protein